MHRETGFTLSELLVVISVLGVLAGVVVFAVGGISDRGQNSACTSDARALRTAVETYQAKNSALPANQAALVQGGFLAKASTLNDFTTSGAAITYSTIGTCAGSAPAPTGQPGTYSSTVLASNPIAYYRLGEANGSTANDSSGGNRHGTYGNSVQKSHAGALTNDANTAANFVGSPVTLSGLPVNATAGASTTVEFWMYWNGTQGVMPFGWQLTDLWFQYGGLGFNNGCSNVEGTSSTGMANRWVHVAAIWVSGDLSRNKLYIDGQPRAISHLGGHNWGSCAAWATLGPNARISGWANDTGYQFRGRIDEVAIFNGELSAATIAAHYASR